MELPPLGPPQQPMQEDVSLKAQKKQCLKAIKDILKQPREYRDAKGALKECQVKATRIDPEFGEKITTILSKCKIASSAHKVNKEVIKEIKKEIESLETEKRPREESEENIDQIQQVREVASEEFHEANPVHQRAWKWISENATTGACHVASKVGGFFKKAANFLPSAQKITSLVVVYSADHIYRNFPGVVQAVSSGDPVEIAARATIIASDVIAPVTIQLGGEVVAQAAIEALGPRRPPPPALPPAEPIAPPPSAKRRRVDPNIHTLNDL